MGKRIPSFLLMLVVLTFGMAACKTHDSAWSDYANKNTWISSQAKDVKYEMHHGSYQARFRAPICYPAMNMIDEMAKTMTGRGWRRMIEDPLNPGHILSHARKPGEQWSDFLYGNDYRVYGWSEYWEDGEGNILWYRFRYQNEKTQRPEQACTVECFSGFVPKEVWQSILKEIDERRRITQEGRG